MILIHPVGCQAVVAARPHRPCHAHLSRLKVTLQQGLLGVAPVPAHLEAPQRRRHLRRRRPRASLHSPSCCWQTARGPTAPQSRGLKKRVRAYFALRWRRTRGFSESSVINDLPRSLALDVRVELYKGLLDRVPLFKGVEDIFVRQLVKFVTLDFYMPDEYVIRKDDVGKEMFFIQRGVCHVLADDERVANVADDAVDERRAVALLLRHEEGVEVDLRAAAAHRPIVAQPACSLPWLAA